MKRTIDVITVYNNIEKYNAMMETLSNSMYKDYNLIGINNTYGQFSSASDAYNYAIDNLCEGEMFVFCHQDIVFPNDELGKIATLCTEEQNVLFGVAGVENKGAHRRIVSSISDANVKKYNSIKSGERIDVFTLDECLIAANKKIFSTVRFDNNVCNGWHFYTVDLSLQCHLNNIAVKVYDSNIIHLSGGQLMLNLENVKKK